MARKRGFRFWTDTLRLVKHMGGTLDLESREGKTIFRVLLPIVNEKELDGDI
jgi:nitrogen-specific signal transduction histidine kinase